MKRMRAIWSWVCVAGWLIGGLVGCGGTGGAQRGAAQMESLPAPRVRLLERASLGGAEICFNGLDDNENGLLDEGCGVEQGEPQFLLAWQDSVQDLDLWVADPQGEVAIEGIVTAGGLAKVQSCGPHLTECSGRSYENVIGQSEMALPGTYEVRVRWEQRAEGASPLRARLGVRLGGQTRAYEIELWAEATEALLLVEHKSE